MNKEELYPKEKLYSFVIIDLWDDKENSAFKILETDDLNDVEEIRKILTIDEYLMIYNRNGETIEINNVSL